MAQSNRVCLDCNYIQGNECYQYSGQMMENCGLITGQWYKIDDLIAALTCAAFSTNTTSPGTGSCDNCICLLVEGYNYINSPIGNGDLDFSYRLYKNAEKTDLVMERTLGSGINNTYTHFGSLDFDGPIYGEMAVNITSQSETFYSFGSDIDLIVTVNEMIVYARSMTIFEKGTNVFPSLPTLPAGRIKIMLYANRFDTNINDGQGIVVVGGIKLSDSIFTINTTLAGGGMIGNPELNWPYVLDNSSDFVFTNFDTDYFGQMADSMQLSVSGTNNELFPLQVAYSFSGDPSLDFTDSIAIGESYTKTLNLTRQQAIDNDFLIRFIK